MKINIDGQYTVSNVDVVDYVAVDTVGWVFSLLMLAWMGTFAFALYIFQK